ncbi:uncharacterized protein B0T15DRAFT_576585 [Chaetomium strumarium]|uniref:Uncharacterized protein n=1 Tax=Chaetomium strumarium TaxID=1170767 RepID=A0AAJ0GNF1_9PEZI|nr:hypothetical protein B0T15DRAFT_576585 [Chaetomium strumarium]
MASESASLEQNKPSRSSCKLVPPCRSVQHGISIDSAGQTKTKPIGKYYFTEDALKYDLAALKKGEVYSREEFYRRAKTWYKAEIDRLLHLKRIEKEDKPEVTLTTQYPTEQREEDSRLIPAQAKGDRISSPAAAPSPTPSPAKAPTRVQPARAAKRKAAERLFTRSSRAPSRRTKGKLAKPHVSDPPPSKETRHPEPEAEPETKGNYALAAYDWAQFLSGNEEEHGRSPWSYIQFQGLDVAYFVMRLERAVRRKTCEIRLGRTGEPGLWSCCAARGATSKADDEEERRKERPKQQQKADCQRRIRNPPPGTKSRCVLDGPRYTAPVAPFTPKAALAPGEDWRSPTVTTTTITSPAKAGDDRKTKTANGGPASTTETTPAASGSKPGIISWAADEVRRRDELNKRAAAAAAAVAAGLAPEAEMEVSPTLGRWQVRARKLEGEELHPVEDLEANNVVEVSSLKFAVDLCACPSEGGAMEAGEEGLRVLMM